MTGRFWLAVVVVFLAFFVMDFVIHELILSGPYEATASLWRTEEDMNRLMPFMWIGTLVMSLFFVLIFGRLRHPPPLNDITPLDTKRKVLAVLSFVLLFLLGTPRPFG